MILTRVGFCEKCLKEGRPKTGLQFIAFGASSNQFLGMIAERNGTKGFVPTLYEFQRLTDKTVYFRKICCFCGSYLANYKDKKYIYLHEEMWEDNFTTLENWNALVLFKDTGFKI